MGNCTDSYLNSKVYNPPQIHSQCLKLFIRKFTPNTQSIFDYLQIIPSQELTITHNGSVCLIDNQFQYTPRINEYKLYSVEQKNILKKTVFQLQKINRSFILKGQNEINPFQQHNIWVNINSLPQKKFYVQKNDILKFGKKLVKVLLIENLPDKKPFQSPSIASINSSCRSLKRRQSIINQLIQCRICLEAGNQANPLVSSCSCDGSVKYIHFKCLKEWIEKSIKIIQNEDHLSFFKKEIKCEMCKHPYQTQYTVGGKQQSLYGILNIQPPFLILEVLQQTAMTSNLCIGISFAKKTQIFIGRKKTSEIRFLNEQSISRTHARISYDKIEKRIILNDLQSRYGTLYKLQKSLQINEHNEGIQFQISNTTIQCKFLLQNEQKQGQKQSKDNNSEKEDNLKSNSITRANLQKITNYTNKLQINIESYSVEQIMN